MYLTCFKLTNNVLNFKESLALEGPGIASLKNSDFLNSLNAAVYKILIFNIFNKTLYIKFKFKKMIYKLTRIEK